MTLVACVVRKARIDFYPSHVLLVDTSCDCVRICSRIYSQLVNISLEYYYRKAVLTFWRAHFQRFSALGKALGTLGNEALPAMHLSRRVRWKLDAGFPEQPLFFHFVTTMLVVLQEYEPMSELNFRHDFSSDA